AGADVSAQPGGGDRRRSEGCAEAQQGDVRVGGARRTCERAGTHPNRQIRGREEQSQPEPAQRRDGAAEPLRRLDAELSAPGERGAVLERARLSRPRYDAEGRTYGQGPRQARGTRRSEVRIGTILEHERGLRRRFLLGWRCLEITALGGLGGCVGDGR